MDHEERKKLIAQYRDGYAASGRSAAEDHPEELDAKPGPGRWTRARSCTTSPTAR